MLAIFLVLAIIFSLFVCLKYRKALKDLRKTRAALQETRAVLGIRVKARTRELEELARTLEERAKERTRELQERVTELEKFHHLTVGRELKMMELKRKVKELEAGLRKA